MYSDDELLQLSGIQHFSFCPRQWALIHIEQQWDENLLTLQGNYIHTRAHDESLREKRGDKLLLRNLSIHSYTLGFSGQCDVVEFTRSAEGIPLHGEEGLWSVVPIEYKRGSSKRIDADRLQLSAQVICLEEMLCCEITTGCLYYHETRSRETVLLDETLRTEVVRCADEMHRLYKKRHTPKVSKKAPCKSCSLANICLPELNRRETVDRYYQRVLGES